MKARAGVLWTSPGEWATEDVDLDEPGNGEVLVRMVASGLCHSDDHPASGHVPLRTMPLCGGHEGAGIVEQVGPGVSGLRVGDHIVTSFIPSCGKCRWCAVGMQNLCDYGALIGAGAQLDGTFRMHIEERAVHTATMLGTFANWQVLDQASCIKVREDVPLDVACLVACGVPTGWGSAINSAQVQVGHTVIVMGVGGVGINAVQGAHYAGATYVIAVDPVEFKRDTALKLGATHAFAGIAEAADFARSVTMGQGADSAIVTTDVVSGEHVTDAFAAVRKAGTVAVTAQGSHGPSTTAIDLFELSMYQKRIQGVLYGSWSPRRSVPMLLDLYREGQLHLDELVTQRYALEQINQAYVDMRAGRNIRGVIVHEH